MQLVNAGKYLSTIVMTTISFYNKDPLMYKFWIFFLLFSTLYSYSWDLRKDFGFLNLKSKNFLLRDRLYYPWIAFYYFAGIINLVLRFTWLLTLSPSFLKNLLYKTLTVTVLGILETFRRTLWNYFRVELENLKYETKYTSI